MSTKSLSQNWPVIRQIIYSLATGALGSLTLMGVITGSDADTYVQYVVTGLGAAATIIAGLNVDRSKPLEPIVPEYVDYLPPVTVDFDAVAARAQAAIDTARADLERQLGR